MDESPSGAPDEPDPDPPAKSNAGDNFEKETHEQHVENTEVKNDGKKEKGRVRFNSRAGSTRRLSFLDAALGSSANSRRGADSRIYEPLGSSPEPQEDLAAIPEKVNAAAAARERARQIAINVESDAETTTTEPSSPSDIPLRHVSQATQGHGNGDVEAARGSGTDVKDEAYQLVRSHTVRLRGGDSTSSRSPLVSAPAVKQRAPLTEINDGTYDGLYKVPAPEQFRGSVLSQLLKLYKPTEQSPQGGHSKPSSWISFSGEQSTLGSESGAATPQRRKWYEQDHSQETLANLVEASARLANPGRASTPSTPGTPGVEKELRRLKHRRARSANQISTLRQGEESTIAAKIAETLSCQRFIIKLCRALMSFGAPTHRLEEYLRMAARFLEIDGNFLYLPGCMMISFDDRDTHTTEVKIIREAQGIDLGKLKDLHTVYKEVLHDVIDVDEGSKRLDELLTKKAKFHPWMRVLVFGLTSVTTAPSFFGGNLIDLPLSFFFGCIVGFLELIVSPKSALYGNIFEISATVLVTFLARAFGSINGGSLFCFSALAQSGIAMLLPGYLVLSSALEIQSHAIIPGSIRLIYAIIYSLLLGFGITVGAALYGLFDRNAISTTTCEGGIPSLYGFVFVPPFVLCICILYQAKWAQMPVMVTVGFAGYVVNYFSNLHFAGSPQVASTLGALAVGVVANLYSRLRHGVAAALLIPAIFAQVPGSLASRGGLLSGLNTANQLANGTSSTASSGGGLVDSEFNSVVFGVAASMIQIAIGIAVGLFLSALIIYPLGKRRSGLFSF